MDERGIRELAVGQHGVVSRGQLRDLGVTDKVIARRVRLGEWERPRRGVYVIGGARRTWDQRVMSAVLAAGHDALASHRTALRVWSLVDRSGQIELLVDARHNPTVAGVRVHRSIHLPGTDGAVVDGIPVTSIARTLVDVSPGHDHRVVGGWIDEAIRRHQLDLVELAACSRRLGGRGRPDLTALRAEIARRGTWFDPGDSELEAHAVLVLREAGLPEPVLQHRVVLPDGSVAYVDLAFPTQKVAIEVDGWGPHGRRAAFTPDRTRRNALTALGWDVYQYTSDMSDAQLVRTVVRALRAASDDL